MNDKSRSNSSPSAQTNRPAARAAHSLSAALATSATGLALASCGGAASGDSSKRGDRATHGGAKGQPSAGKPASATSADRPADICPIIDTAFSHFEGPTSEAARAQLVLAVIAATHSDPDRMTATAAQADNQAQQECPDLRDRALKLAATTSLSDALSK